MRQGIVLIGLVLALVLLYASPCWAGERVGRLKADRIHYDYEHEMVTAEGQVILTYQDLAIKADHIYLAVKGKQLEAVGHVEIKRGEESYFGDRFSYDFKREKGFLEPLNMEIRGEGIKGALYGSGEQLRLEGDSVYIHNGTITSCDLEHPHYRLVAAEMEYHPDDKVIFRHVWYYESKIPLFYWPYLYISLKEEENNFLTPVIGHDSYKGWFLNLGYMYFTDTLGKGVILLDFMERLGTGYGLRHTYNFKDQSGKTTAEFYRLDNKKTGFEDDKVILYTEKKWADKWRLSLGFKWEEVLNWDYQSRFYYVTDNFDYTTRLNYSSSKLTFSNQLDFLQREKEYSTYWAPSFRWNPLPNGYVSLSGSYRNVDYRQSDDSTKYKSLNLTYDQRIWNNHQLNLRMLRSTQEVDSLKISSPSLNLGWFPQIRWTSELYHLIPPVYSGGTEEEGTRFGLTLDASSRPLYQAGKFSLYMGGAGKYYSYWTTKGDGDQSTISTSLNAKHQLMNNLWWELGTGWTQGFGEAPVFSGLTQYVYEGGNVTYRLNYNPRSFQFGINGGYNLTHQLWESQNLRMAWSPISDSSFNVNLSYHPEYDTGSVSTTISYRPSPQNNVQLDYRYDMYSSGSNYESLYMALNLEQNIGELWSVKLSGRYNLLDDYGNTARVSIAYNWHCRTVIFGYDYYYDQYTLQYIINAFPNYEISFNSESGLYWDNLFNSWYNGVRQ